MQTNKQQPAFETVNDKIQQTDHSLSADLAMGWRPKLKVIGPIPLNFDNALIDKSIKELLKSQASIYSIIYLGPRPLNTFKMHQILKKKYKYKYQHLFSVEYGHLKAFFHKFYSQFQPKMKMPFLGMNPIYKSHKLNFDSCFQSGNLDCVIKVNDTQYDLILRIDSNTAGHIMWYYFKVTNNENKNLKVKFNIVNLRKNKSCYQRGMKPFIRKKKKNDTENLKRNNTENQSTQQWTQWQQGGINVQVTQQKLRFAKQTITFNNGLVEIQQQPIIFRRLSFQIQFQPSQQIQFAYCIPYTYSNMITDIRQWKQSITDRGMKNVHFGVDMSNQSLSGLEIPLIKITEKQGQKYDQESQKKKQSVFIIGRQHPGESNGSWVMKGLISQLIDDSPQIRFLRKHIVFTIIPMLNVDGVVMGNFRTSLYGKDLNRLFRKQQLFLIPQVQICKQQFNKLIKVFKTKIMLFMDIHGHSARRNAFCYGPGILDSNSFNDVRQFAKIIALKTQIFRYPSCSFRIQHDKKTTARACFSKSVKLAYTIESSNWSFYSRSLGRMIDFTSQYWQSIGIDIIYSLSQYAQDKIIKTKGKTKKNNKNKNNQKNTVTKINQKRNLINGQIQINNLKSQCIINEKQSPQRKRIKRAQTTKQIPTGNQQKIQQKKINQNKTHADKIRPKQQQSTKQQQTTGRQTISKSSKYLKMQQIQQQQNESDKMSDNQMDSDSQDQDIQRSRFQKYMNNAKKMMIQFQKVYLGDQYEKKGRTAAKLRQEKAKLAGRDSRNIKKNSQVLACLRKKQPTQQQQPQNIQLLQINNTTRLPQTSKQKQSHRKQPNQPSLPLNTKQIQFQYQYPQQQQQITKQIMLINHKSQYQKILLPRIQQSYKIKRKRQYLQGMIVGGDNDYQRQDDYNQNDRVQQWTYGQRTPQLLMNDDQDQQHYHNNNDHYSNNRNKIHNKRAIINRQKSISNYQHNKRNNRIDFYQNNQYQQKQQKLSNRSQSSYQQLQQQNQKGYIKMVKKQSNDDQLLQENSNNYYQQQQNVSISPIISNIQNISNSSRQNYTSSMVNNPSTLRYSMKLSPTNPSKQSILTKTKRQLQQIKKIQLIQKLSDPISKAYVENMNSLHELKGHKEKGLQFVEIQGISVTNKDQQTRLIEHSQRITSNNSKIKQIILSNLQQIKGNRKSYARTKRQKHKMIIDQKYKQKLSIQQPMYLIQGQDLRDSIIQSFNSNTNNNNIPLIFSSNNNNNNKKFPTSISPQKISNLLNNDKGQSLISTSVILPRANNNNTKLLSQKIRTLESQNIIKLSQQSIITTKGFKNVKTSSTRNYSQRQTKIHNDILKQEQRLNFKAMKFSGDSLPKLVGDKEKEKDKQKEKQKQKRSPQKQFSKTKISLHKPVDPREKQSPSKGERLARIKPLTGTQLNEKEKDHKKIKFIINGHEDTYQLKSSSQLQRHYQNKKRDNPSSKQTSNREILINRLKQLQSQGRQQFGQGNLLLNAKQFQNNRQKEMTDNLRVSQNELVNKKLQLGKKIKTNMSEQGGNYQQQYVQESYESPKKKETKIFSLPMNRYSMAINSNKQSYMK